MLMQQEFRHTLGGTSTGRQSIATIAVGIQVNFARNLSA